MPPQPKPFAARGTVAGLILEIGLKENAILRNCLSESNKQLLVEINRLLFSCLAPSSCSSVNLTFAVGAVFLYAFFCERGAKCTEPSSSFCQTKTALCIFHAKRFRSVRVPGILLLEIYDAKSCFSEAKWNARVFIQA